MLSLMGRSSDGDEQRRALMETIFREHFSAVHRYIVGKVGQLDAADDLTSMVFLKAFRWLLEDRGVKQVRSWLYATARTTIVDYWLERLEEDPVALFAPQHNEQVQTYVYHLLHSLPERERQVLILRYFQGYSTAEVGQTPGLQVGHVRVLQLRALRHAALLETQERKLPSMSEVITEPVAVYTEQGQRVLALAQEEAIALHHQLYRNRTPFARYLTRR
jgi:RNA polymerase sigma factor, sigma-70 family